MMRIFPSQRWVFWGLAPLIALTLAGMGWVAYWLTVEPANWLNAAALVLLATCLIYLLDRLCAHWC